MTNKPLERLSDVMKDLETPRGFLSAQSKLQRFDIESLSDDERRWLIRAIKGASRMRGGPLLVLSLPSHIQAEMSLFGGGKILGVDRTAYRRATPDQVVRRLTTGSMDMSVYETLVSGYDFNAFNKTHWQAYFTKCNSPIAAAKRFLAKDEAQGGFSDDEITQLALQNPAMVSCMPVDRLAPNTVVALLISGRAPGLWQTYDFRRLGKNHWRELLLHTNPDTLPEASRPFIENKDGKGFSEDELLTMARKCHALISSLNPNKVPFNIAYELYLTGKADYLWKNFPFASLDKSEWRRILSNPDVKIPPIFLEIAKGGRFKAEELCQLAFKNERICPFLVDLNVSPDLVVDVLINSKADYVWEHYRFSQFSVVNWERLIFGLKIGEVLRPRAMAALKSCKGITEAFASKVVSWNTSYAPNLPIASIAPDVAVDILLRGKGYFLWSAYTFERLSDDQWLRLLSGTNEPISQAGISFLRTRSGAVDQTRLEALLLKRTTLVEYVDAKYVSPQVAAILLARNSEHELWERYDFSRFDRTALRGLIKATKRTKDWPQSFAGCFNTSGKPFDFADLLEIAATRPDVVVRYISTEWASSCDDDLFAKLVVLAARSGDGLKALKSRLDSNEKSWKRLPVEKLKRLLVTAPEVRSRIEWQKWPFRDIDELVAQKKVFEEELPRPIRFFFWKHFKSLVAMGALTAAAVVAVLVQNQELAREDEQRQRLNAIVRNVTSLDGNRNYQRLGEFWDSLAVEDKTVIERDLLVKRARGNLASWRVDCKSIESGMLRLRRLSQNGWGSVSEDSVAALIKELEACHISHYAEASEFHRLKSEHSEYRKREAERKRIGGLREKLSEISDGISGCEEIDRLTSWKLSVSMMAKEPELANAAEEVGERLRERIEAVQARIDAERIAKEVSAISNAVISVSAEMKATSALKDFDSWVKEFNAISEMPGFDGYREMPCYVNYEILADDYRLFASLKDKTVANFAEARRLDEKFKSEFMTVDAGTECSNVVASCELVLSSAKSKSWPALAEASQRVVDLVDKINARDKRCWSLIDKLNEATDYASYLSANKKLVRDFGQFSQLRHMCGLCNLEPEDLKRSYKIMDQYTWGREKTYRYHYVGLVSLKPHDPTKTAIDVRPNTTTYSADLYALRKTPSGDISATKFVRQQGQGKFYKVTGVDDSGAQGMPLFVRSEHYTGKGE